ncbi:NfeD family protein [Tahibacter caeni]|uniref:NfeD family protein n=1 Tax=Tahibacter caeni TaxID=1453545 RepID=UPI00214986C4|nr:NfeD family protein [Tahibacter caeni]
MDLISLWWIAALVLIAAEIVLPGFFLLWIGLAAAGVGILLLLVPGLGLLGQAVAFAALAFASCFGYWRLARDSLRATPAPTLNRRAEQLVGQHYVLATAIENGRGKAHVGDSLWSVEGPDLPAGARVAVVGVDGTLLRVQAVDAAD